VDHLGQGEEILPPDTARLAPISWRKGAAPTAKTASLYPLLGKTTVPPGTARPGTGASPAIKDQLEKALDILWPKSSMAQVTYVPARSLPLLPRITIGATRLPATQSLPLHGILGATYVDHNPDSWKAGTGGPCMPGAMPGGWGYPNNMIYWKMP